MNTTTSYTVTRNALLPMRDGVRLSTALGISKSDLAREALKRYLRVAEFRTLRTKLVARAQAGGINTDEEVFDVLKRK